MSFELGVWGALLPRCGAVAFFRVLRYGIEVIGTCCKSEMY